MSDEEASRRGDTEPPRRNALLTPADKVTIAYLTIISVLALISIERVSYWREIVGAHLLTIALVTGLALWENKAARPRSRAVSSSPGLEPSNSPSFLISRFFHAWYPVALIPFAFKELTYAVPLFHPRDFDVQLAALDHRLFGVHPTVWLEKLTWPPLTEVLQLVYATYYFLPIVLGAVLWRKAWFDKYGFWVFIVALGFFLSYLGYIVVPATGPRFLQSIVESQTEPLKGVFLFRTVRGMLDQAEGVTRDCFPSGHVEMTLLVLYYAGRFHRRTFWCLLPFGAGVIVSTVYLRYHYVVDVAAGVLLAVAVIWSANRFYKTVGGLPPR